MARLTKEQWANARARWENDPDMTFGQLAKELDISRPGVSKTAASEGWTKGGAAEVTEVTAPAKVTTSKVTKVTADKPPKAGKGAGKVISLATGKEHQPAPQKPKAPAKGKPADAEWQLMEARPVGRPSEYVAAYATMLIDFFNIEVEKVVDVEVFNHEGKATTEKRVVVNTFPTLTRFASKLNVCRDTLHNWATERNKDGSFRHPEFSDAYARARDMQDALIIEGGMAGKYESRFATLAAKNLIGWKDQVETTVETPTNVAVIETLNDTYLKGIENAKIKRLEMIERRKQFAVEAKD